MKSFYLFLPALLVAGLLSAQNTKGFFVNFNGSASGLKYENTAVADAVLGYGYDFRLGIGISPASTFFLGTSRIQVMEKPESVFAEEYAIAEYELGTRYYFGGGGARVKAFLEIMGQYVKSEPFPGADARGAGVGLAPGLLFFLSERVAIDTRLRVSGAYMYDVRDTELDLRVPEDSYTYTTARLNVGLTFYPSVRRSRYSFERGGGHL
ncbi:MAG: hypothetical protein WA952_12620 [Lewinella sp.]